MAQFKRMAENVKFPSMDERKAKAFKLAMTNTLPVFAGFSFLGFTYGMLMSSIGFKPWVTPIVCITVFGGSVQFVLCNMLLGNISLASVLMVTAAMNARHLFYGISIYGKFKEIKGWKKIYLIYAMCDETFSVNYSTQIDSSIDKDWYYVFVTFLDQSYWVVASTLGAIFGSVVELNVKGLDFAMTAMFSVIFLNEWLSEDSHTSSIVGLAVSVLCLVVVRSSNFVLPSMALIFGILTLLRKRLEDKK